MESISAVGESHVRDADEARSAATAADADACAIAVLAARLKWKTAVVLELEWADWGSIGSLCGGNIVQDVLGPTVMVFGV